MPRSTAGTSVRCLSQEFSAGGRTLPRSPTPRKRLPYSIRWNTMEPFQSPARLSISIDDGCDRIKENRETPPAGSADAGSVFLYLFWARQQARRRDAESAEKGID